MADVTGRIYEAFTEFILRKLGYHAQWESGDGRQYLYEEHVDALCYRSEGICPHAEECWAWSQEHDLDYGPWYDPDFFVFDEGQPIAGLHVTHWSSPSDSQRKFWRTIEDHFQFKTLFGDDFLSLNLVFVALDEGEAPFRVVDSNELIELHGWKPAVGATLCVSFDSSLLFPREYGPLKLYADQLPESISASGVERQKFYNDLWQQLYNTEPAVKDEVDRVTDLLQDALSNGTHPRYTYAAIDKLREECFRGRKNATALHHTFSRYRKGIQHAFILHGLLDRHFGDYVDAESALWNLLTSDPRFPRARFAELIGLPEEVPDEQVRDFFQLLSTTPIQMKKRVPQPLLEGEAGMGHAEWNDDLAQFIIGLQNLSNADLQAFRENLRELFEQYETAYGMEDVLADLANSERVQAKIEYVGGKYIGVGDKGSFIENLADDMLTPGQTPPHQQVVEDVHNWVIDIMLEYHGLGSMQEITTRLPGKFQETQGHAIQSYAFQGDPSRLVGHLLAGVDVKSSMSGSAELSRDEFYESVWPLFAECIWEAIQGKEPLDPQTTITNHRYKKAMRIISSPDLEPIAFLFRESLPQLDGGLWLRGAFNELSKSKDWSSRALITLASGEDPVTEAIIQTQSVFGKKHIADKTSEVAGRMRAQHIRCDDDEVFQPEPDPGVHYLVVDGDWPISSKINLLEAGFSGIFEIAELDRLSDELERLAGDSDSE